MADGRSSGLRFGFPKSVRLRRSPDFQAVQRGGRRHPGRLLVGILRRSGSPGARFGLAVSRKVGNAVVRNRVKRLLREAIRHLRHEVDGVDVVFIALPSSAGADGPALRDEVAKVLSRAQRS